MSLIRWRMGSEFSGLFIAANTCYALLYIAVVLSEPYDFRGT